MGRLLLVATLVAFSSVGAVPLTEDVAVEQTVARTSVDRLTVDGFRVGYAGSDVDAVTVVVNNTGTNLVSEIRVSLLTVDRQPIAAAQTTTTAAPGRSEVTVAFDGAHSTDAVSLVRIRIRRSSL